MTVFPGEQYEAPRSRTERAYPKLIYYNRVDKGGHFAAWEQPQLFGRGNEAELATYVVDKGKPLVVMVE